MTRKRTANLLVHVNVRKDGDISNIMKFMHQIIVYVHHSERVSCFSLSDVSVRNCCPFFCRSLGTTFSKGACEGGRIIDSIFAPNGLLHSPGEIRK